MIPTKPFDRARVLNTVSLSATFSPKVEMQDLERMAIFARAFRFVLPESALE
jgi:hypothetical protein